MLVGMTNVLPRQPLPVIEIADACCPTPLPAVDVPPALVRTLKSIADETRLWLLVQIARSAEPICVCDLVGAAPVNQPTVSHHLKVLREAGVLAVERRGIWAYYSLRPDLHPAVQAVIDQLR